MTRLGTISPLIFSDSLIISLTKDWINHFQSVPKFDVSIDKKGRLCIISKDFIPKRRKNND